MSLSWMRVRTLCSSPMSTKVSLFRSKSLKNCSDLATALACAGNCKPRNSSCESCPLESTSVLLKLSRIPADTMQDKEGKQH